MNEPPARARASSRGLVARIADAPAPLFAFAGLVLLACSAVRHELFHSNAYDLGWFDQAVYLISRGAPPIVSLSGFHILGDHAAFVLYLLAPLYAVHASVYWLLAAQAAAFAAAAWLVWSVARVSGLDSRPALCLGAAFLLYPLVLDLALFDFHPETLAVPGVLAAALAAQRRKPLWFAAALLFVLACKEVLALNVIGLGAWLACARQRRAYGIAAALAGVAWFALATRVVIPGYSGREPAALARYASYGATLPEVAAGMVTRPGGVTSRVLSVDALRYLAEVAAPVAWGLSPAHLGPLLGAVPTLALNVLSDYPRQRSLLYQYSAPALPFLFLAVVSARAAGRGRPRRYRLALLWSLAAFLAMAQYDRFWTQYVARVDTWRARRQALALVRGSGAVLTTSDLVPHLAHREHIVMTDVEAPLPDVAEFTWVLLDLRHPGWRGSADRSAALLRELEARPAFTRLFDRDGVLLFVSGS